MSAAVNRMNAGSGTQRSNGQEINWAFLSDAEVSELAAQALKGLVADELLQKMSRREIISLLIVQRDSGITAGAKNTEKAQTNSHPKHPFVVNESRMTAPGPSLESSSTGPLLTFTSANTGPAEHLQADPTQQRRVGRGCADVLSSDAAEGAYLHSNGNGHYHKEFEQHDYSENRDANLHAWGLLETARGRQDEALQESVCANRLSAAPPEMEMVTQEAALSFLCREPQPYENVYPTDGKLDIDDRGPRAMTPRTCKNTDIHERVSAYSKAHA